MSVETTHTVKWVLQESRWILCESKWISQEISSGVHGMVVQTDIATSGDNEKVFCVWKDYLHLENYLKTRQSQVCLGTLKDAQEFGQFLGNTRLPKHPG